MNDPFADRLRQTFAPNAGQTDELVRRALESRRAPRTPLWAPALVIALLLAIALSMQRRHIEETPDPEPIQITNNRSVITVVSPSGPTSIHGGRARATASRGRGGTILSLGEAQ